MALLKTSLMVKLVSPLWGASSVAAVKLNSPKDKPSDASLSVLSDDGIDTYIMLTVDPSWGEPIILQIGKHTFEHCSSGSSLVPINPAVHGPKDQNYSPYKFHLKSADLIGVKQAVISHVETDASGKTTTKVSTIPLLTVPPPPPTLAVVEPVKVQDEVHVTIKSASAKIADLTAVSSAYYDTIRLEIEHSGFDLLVKLDPAMTAKPGKKEIKLLFRDGRIVYVPIVVLP